MSIIFRCSFLCSFLLITACGGGSNSESSPTTCAVTQEVLSEDEPLIGAVELYADCNYQGYMVELTTGDINATSLSNAGFADNSLSSVRISHGFKVELFKHDHQSGPFITLTEDDACLVQSSFNDVVSSLRFTELAKPEMPAWAQVCLYDQVDYGGNSLCLAQSEIPRLKEFNNRTQSIQIKDGFYVDAFASNNYTGESVRLTVSQAQLADAINNAINSFKIRNSLLVCDSCEASDFDSLQVLNHSTTDINGGTYEKGDDGLLTLNLASLSLKKPVPMKVKAYLSSSSFDDFSDVSLPEAYFTLDGCTAPEIKINIPSLLQNFSNGTKYAVNRGDYSVRIEVQTLDGENIPLDESTFNFSVQPSSVIFPVIIFDDDYLQEQSYPLSGSQYASEVFTRPVALYHSSSNTYSDYTGGFDEMLNVRHQPHAFPGYSSPNNSGQGQCEYAADEISRIVGLPNGWRWGLDPNSNAFLGTKTSRYHHGFDTAIVMDSNWGGGVACGWINIQVSGFIGLERDRNQVVMLHETGHIMGAPHCDPESGYVMCSAEVHARYQQEGVFVWHESSRLVLSDRFNE